MAVARINEAALLKAGVDRATIEALRHIARQVGDQTGGTTLPEVAEQGDLLTPVVSALQLAVTALQAQAAVLDAEQANVPVSDRELRRQIEEMQAEMQAMRVSSNRLEKRVETLENGVE